LPAGSLIRATMGSASRPLWTEARLPEFPLVAIGSSIEVVAVMGLWLAAVRESR
jgi:hypothetical protein